MTGIICMWDGLIVNIPNGWSLCNGANGTPDLREKFIRGAPDETEPGNTGGSETHTHLVAGNTTSTNIFHHHTFEDEKAFAEESTDYTYVSGPGSYCVNSDSHCHPVCGCTDCNCASHLHPMSFTSGSCSTLPSYYELLFIKKT